MFRTIVQHEVAYWLRQPAFYLYLAAFFFASLLLMAGTAGYFDPPRSQNLAINFVNSPINIFWASDFLGKFALFLVPLMLGLSTYRDFSSRMNQLLFAYPIQKSQYLLAKFVSSFFMLSLVLLSINVGFIAAQYLPAIDQTQFTQTGLWLHFKTYLTYTLPNFVMVSLLVFAVVTRFRNLYLGFLIVFIFIAIQEISLSLFSQLDLPVLVAILDPFGKKAALLESAFWSLEQRNSLELPFTLIVLMNRILWLSVSVFVTSIILKNFRFHQLSESHKRSKAQKSPTDLGKPNQVRRIIFPAVNYRQSFAHHLQTMWAVSALEFRFILRSPLFIGLVILSAVLLYFQQAQMAPQYGFEILPVTWKMLKIPAFLFTGVVHLISFLYAGILLHRSKNSHCNEIVDCSPAPTWVLLLSKLIALGKMQFVLLSLIILAGLSVQLSQGFFDLNLGLYIFSIYGKSLLTAFLWACFGMFVLSLFKTQFVALFFLFGSFLAIGMLPEFGVDHLIFQYNSDPAVGGAFAYSDLSGFGNSLPAFYLYKLYFACTAICLIILAIFFVPRGLPLVLKDRLRQAAERKTTFNLSMATLSFLAAISLASFIYIEDTIIHPQPPNSRSVEATFKAAHQKYAEFSTINQAKISAVKTKLDIFPSEQRFVANGHYSVANRSELALDTLIINTGFDEKTRFSLNRDFTVLVADSALHFFVLKLASPLMPNDSLLLNFTIENKANTLFQQRSNVLENGTMIKMDAFPRLFYRFNPAEKAPTLQNRFSSAQGADANNIHFSATVSTSADQIALSIGSRQREEIKDGRYYAEFKTEKPVKFGFSFHSGRFRHAQSAWKNVPIDIYFHPSHSYAIQDMIDGTKAALAYNSRNFSNYQHSNVRIVEFPLTQGSYATTFANLFPTSELRFLSAVDRSNAKNVNLPFYIAAHEMAHQWWGNQVLAANTQGAKFLSESLAEYSALRALEARHGVAPVRTMLRLNLLQYLRGRSNETDNEPPLMLTDERQYISYRKGAIVLRTLSQFLGESQFNAILKTYVDQVKFQEAPFTISADLVALFKAHSPDSIQYFIHDNFERVTVYSNQMSSAIASKSELNRFSVTFEFLLQKYHAEQVNKKNYINSQGETQSEGDYKSLPLNDFIQIGFFNSAGEEILLKTLRISQIKNKQVFVLPSKASEVILDPYNQLIDDNPSNNKIALTWH